MPARVATGAGPMADDRYDDVGLDEHRALVEALPHRLLPLIAAGVMTPAEAQAHIRQARTTLAARLGRAGGAPGPGGPSAAP